MSYRNKLVAGLWLIAISLCASCNRSNPPDNAAVVEKGLQDSVSAQDSITFGVYTTDKPTTVVKMMAPALNSLEELLNQKLDQPVEIKMRVINEYDAGIEMIASGEIDISRLGPASYIAARSIDPNLQLLAMESNGGQRKFNGVIAVHRDSDIKSLGQLKGKSFAFGDELSTIGRYLSQALLLEAGLSANDFSNYEYLGRHDTVGMAVAAGDFTAGALKENTFVELVESGEPIKVLTKFDNVTKPWVARGGLDPTIASALKSALLEIDGQKVASVCDGGFLEADDSYFEPISAAIAASKEFVQ